MVDLDLSYTPATELARRIAARELSPVEVVENSLARIDEVNPGLNCFCFTYPEEALEKARAAERAVAAGKPLGPLHGVPIAIKDLTPTKGKRTTLGSYSHQHWVPDADAAIVEKLLAAGAIMVGKTNTPEFAYSSFTESPLWGITRNPWKPSRSPGGSSGGSGAAVASGCVPLAEGSDMGGSVRIPAALCGIAGLKPSFGRIPFDILPSQFDQISHFGPLARTVGDIALFLSVAQGPDERDIQTQKPALDIPIPPPTDLSGMSLALCPDLGYYALHDEVEANLRAAAEALREAGATVTEVDLDWDISINRAWHDHWAVYLAAFFGDLLEEWRDRMDPNVAALMDKGLAMSAVDFKRLEFTRTRQWQSLAPILTDHDALLCPTMAQPAKPVGAGDGAVSIDPDDGRFHGYDMTELFNFVSQCPAFSVPSGFTADGLPTAMQIIGRRFDDNGVLRIGAALERVRPWADKRPRLEE
ncbi:MAG: amidase [Proteobacteria bacterium]|nr:amidase [Pseudomonadota bacterium]